MKRILHICLFVSLLIGPINANDYSIYSIDQEIPMGEKDEVLKKNFFVNLGEKQGIEVGNYLEVFRVFSRMDPYESKQRYRYRIKIGELEVIHTEENSAITQHKVFNDSEKSPLFEINNFMIGDKVDVKTN